MSAEISQAMYEAILEKRARALAQVPLAQDGSPLVCSVALVGVGPEVFGVPIEAMHEIVRVPPITALPGLPAWLPGIVQIRGEVFGVVDLGEWFGIAEGREERYLVVLGGFKVPLGLLVGSVLGFRDVRADEIASGLRDGDCGVRPVSFTTRDLVSVLDLDALARSPDLTLSPSGPPRFAG